jgi:hypothetical protein
MLTVRVTLLLKSEQPRIITPVTFPYTILRTSSPESGKLRGT